MPATYVCFPLAPLGWHLWLFRRPSPPSEVRLAKLGILECYNEDAALIPKHFPLITLDMHSCKHKLAQRTETIQAGLQEATCWLIYTLRKYLCPEEDRVQILKAEQPLPKVDFFAPPPFSKTYLGSSVWSWLPGFLFSENNLPICIYMKLAIYMQCHVLTKTRDQKSEKR